MAIEFVKGLLFGITVSGFNNLLAILVLRRATDCDPKDSKRKFKIAGVLFLRYLLYFFVLFLVYKNPPMLIGTGLGLAAVTHILVFANFKRKG